MFSQCSSQSVLDAGVTGIGNWRALDIGANSPRQRVAILVRNGPLRHHKHTLTPPKSKSVWGPFWKPQRFPKEECAPFFSNERLLCLRRQGPYIFFSKSGGSHTKMTYNFSVQHHDWQFYEGMKIFHPNWGSKFYFFWLYHGIRNGFLIETHVPRRSQTSNNEALKYDRNSKQKTCTFKWE